LCYTTQHISVDVDLETVVIDIYALYYLFILFTPNGNLQNICEVYKLGDW